VANIRELAKPDQADVPSSCQGYPPRPRCVLSYVRISVRPIFTSSTLRRPGEFRSGAVFVSREWEVDQRFAAHLYLGLGRKCVRTFFFFKKKIIACRDFAWLYIQSKVLWYAVLPLFFSFFLFWRDS
jgi:hypothetical protein